jgi:membrane associated rhomboid family serine protease
VVHGADSTALSSALQVLLAGTAVGPAIRARRKLPAPRLTIGVLSVLFACAVAQAFHPALLALGERSPMVGHGQPWRLLTSPWFQDGGLAGTVFNLIMLVAIGWVAEATLGPRCWVTAYASGALAGGLAGLVWQPVGAGNSTAILGVAGALFAARAMRAGSRGQRLNAAAPLLVCLVMAGLRDIHGPAVLAGALAGATCIKATR